MAVRRWEEVKEELFSGREEELRAAQEQLRGEVRAYRYRAGPRGEPSGVADQASGNRIEQRPLLRDEKPPASATIVVRGGTDTRDKLRRHVHRTARAWSLDGQPLLGISVFAVFDMSLEELLRRRFRNFRTIYLPTAATLAGHGFDLLPTGQRPHFTACLVRGDDLELDQLLAALGAAQPNPQYAGGDLP